jgi:hypothetical protein
MWAMKDAIEHHLIAGTFAFSTNRAPSHQTSALHLLQRVNSAANVLQSEEILDERIDSYCSV